MWSVFKIVQILVLEQPDQVGDAQVLGRLITSIFCLTQIENWRIKIRNDFLGFDLEKPRDLVFMVIPYVDIGDDRL